MALTDTSPSVLEAGGGELVLRIKKSPLASLVLRQGVGFSVYATESSLISLMTNAQRPESILGSTMESFG